MRRQAEEGASSGPLIVPRRRGAASRPTRRRTPMGSFTLARRDLRVTTAREPRTDYFTTTVARGPAPVVECPRGPGWAPQEVPMSQSPNVDAAGLALALTLSETQERDQPRAVSLLRSVRDPEILRAAERVLVESEITAVWVHGRLLALELDAADVRVQRATVATCTDLRLLRAAQVTLNAHEGDERLAGWMTARIAVLDALRHAERVEAGEVAAPKTRTEKKRAAANAGASIVTLSPSGRTGMEPFVGYGA